MAERALKGRARARSALAGEIAERLNTNQLGPRATQPSPGVEPSAVAVPARREPRARIETLSDLVFGLALSLGAFVLISRPPQSTEDLYTGLVIFGFSFLILVNVWHNYSSIMSVLPIATRGLLVLNLVLLFVVAVEPYLLNVIAFSQVGDVAESASVLYALDIAAMNVILAAFMHILAQEEKGLLSPSAAQRMKFTRNFVLLFGGLFALTALPVFWQWSLLSYPSRLVIWTLTLPAGWVLRVVNRWTASRPA